ncbi:MAG: hypothetical protein ACK4TA_01320 [Saprospiraceae bacterium]
MSDILEQIEKLNKMIDFHLNQSGEDSMRRQYEHMRQQFVEELDDLLKSFQLTVQPIDKAA